MSKNDDGATPVTEVPVLDCKDGNGSAKAHSWIWQHTPGKHDFHHQLCTTCGNTRIPVRFQGQ